MQGGSLGEVLLVGPGRGLRNRQIGNYSERMATMVGKSPSHQTIATRYLRIVGALLIALGIVHIAATPHIPALLLGSPAIVYNRAVGPTLLNHVLAGILLIPLGYTTWLAAVACERGEGWAKRLLVVNTVVVFTLPLSIAVFMRPSEYYTAPLFAAGVGLVFIISLLATASFLIIREQPRRR